MGKSSKMKAIRRLASAMPSIKNHQVVGTVVSGEELLKKGIDKVQGVPVDPSLNYKNKQAVEGVVNHRKQMKRLYNKHGGQGIQAYVAAVQNHVKQTAQA